MPPCFRVIAGLVLLAGPAVAQSPSGAIRLNQVGFYPAGPKVAVVVGAAAGPFHVVRTDVADTVFSGVLGAAATWGPSGEAVRQAVFTTVAAPGPYVLDVPGAGRSHPFRIGAGVHDAVARAALKSYYFQRASTPILAAYGGAWARPAGHPDRAVLVHPSAASAGRPAGTVLAAPRGWYDAGDYNKYVVNSGIATATLLGLHEAYPAYTADLDVNLPESGNGVPDVLDEALWNVRWMLAMQDPADGGVYHKLTNANFDGYVMPHQATTARYVVQKGTAAALDFAATAALAARVYAPYPGLPGLADSLRSAALAAWRWARRHPAVTYRQGTLNGAYDPDIQTGEYGDAAFGDEFAWASMELYVTTRADSFLAVTRPLQPAAFDVPGWPNVRTLGYLSLLTNRRALTAAVDTAALKAAFRTFADGLAARPAASAYGVVMGSGDFYWGSNGAAGNQGVLLLTAHRVFGDARYRDAALANLDYLLGRNATGYSFVTGFGGRRVLAPHHRPSIADGVAAPVPGFLAGGPNPGREDAADCTSEGAAYPSTLPARAYLDHRCSYASNEVAINWNAPLVYLAAGLEAAFSPTGTPTDATAGSPRPFADAAPVVYPNPARGAATVRLTLPAASRLTVAVYDALGRRVRTALDRAAVPPGPATVALDLGGLPAGPYLVRVETAGAVFARTLAVGR